MTKKHIAIIYEGEKTERLLVQNINLLFFGNQQELVPIMLPAGENIYMLWKQLQKDEFQTDVIEVLREVNSTAKNQLEGFKRTDFMEVYLFFDYDGHNANLKNGEDIEDVLNEMLNTFDEETEFGKLYINYPMVESLRDNMPTNQECCYRRCSMNIDDSGTYKNSVHFMLEYKDFRKLTIEKWEELRNNSVCKLNCIVNNRYELIERDRFIKELTQLNLYNNQLEKYIVHGKIAIINSFPLFLWEYFKEEHWKEITRKGL